MRNGWMLAAALALAAPGIGSAGAKPGAFEFSVHYSSWSLNLLRGAIESQLGDALQDNLQDEFLEQIRRSFPDAQLRDYRQAVAFDSGGHNFGAEFRWYPRGRRGSFSLGVAVEKTAMRLAFPEVSAEMDVTSAAFRGSGTFRAEATDTGAELDPLSFHFSCRWDISPSWRVRPYVTLGFGLFSAHELEKGTLHAAYSGTLTAPGVAPIPTSDSFSKTVRQAIDEANEDGEGIALPPLLPILQLSLGVKAEITEVLHLLVEAGIWNGFMLRGGIAVRL
jgi:hypothetical protein